MFHAAEHWVNAPMDLDRLKDVCKLPSYSQEDSIRRSHARSRMSGVDASRRPDGVVRAGHEVRSGRCDQREHRDASDGAAEAMEAARRELEIENHESRMNHIRSCHPRPLQARGRSVQRRCPGRVQFFKTSLSRFIIKVPFIGRPYPQAFEAKGGRAESSRSLEWMFLFETVLLKKIHRINFPLKGAVPCSPGFCVAMKLSQIQDIRPCSTQTLPICWSFDLPVAVE